jgi:Domain of Unknown Function with PDB structure (DUF3857)
MMKKYFITLIIAFVTTAGSAQVNVLDASTIPAALKEKAHSIKREEKIDFEVNDIDAAKLTVHQVFTVLDAQGEEALYFYQYSTAFRKLNDAEIKVYDANGKFVNKYKLKEMHAISMGEGLVEDGRDYFFRVAAPSYPITVQYDYEVKYKGTLNYPNYYIEEPEQSVENSTYTAAVPSWLDLRFKGSNTSITPSIDAAGKNKIYRWEAKNLSAIPEEKGGAKGFSNYPEIIIAPNKFSMDGNEGDLTSWKKFGLWYYNLCKGVVNLSDETKASLKAMVQHAASDKEKMAIIYKYLQANFRYVSIQLGIGGYKPFDAAFVNDKKYGDCKALSNYAKACLDAVGINSYYAIINCEYNSKPVDPSFPQNAFNHVILCVPMQKDTTWLECTSNTSDFGVLGSFTENRNALLITPEGGVLVSTPRSRPTENTFSCTTKVMLNEDASGESLSDIKTSGEFKQELIHYLINETRDDQKKYLVKGLGFVQPDDFEFTKEAKTDSAETAFKFAIDKVPEFMAGSKMFLNPRIYKMWDEKLPSDEDRHHDYYFEYPFTKIDTTVYQLPENYTVDNLPKARDNKFEFGSFKTSYSYDEKSNTVRSIAALSLSQNVIPADKYESTHKFFSNVIDEYTEKIVIKKK